MSFTNVFLIAVGFCLLLFVLKYIKGRRDRNYMAPDGLMTSQLAAFYALKGSEDHKNAYIERLRSMGFSKRQARAMLDFESSAIKRFDKRYLLDPEFTQSWFFNLNQPFFARYPKTKEEILKERSLTVSELAKLIDEAEWHFWNSHERDLSSEVWGEICTWRFGGAGEEFVIRYYELISMTTSVPIGRLAAYNSREGGHLNRYKWGG